PAAPGPGERPESAVSVATVTQAARDVLEGAFPPLWVRGEVMDFKAHRNGHWYFCLRDAGAQVRCVVWSRDQRRIPAPPDDGMQVAALGQLTVYPTRGEMQLTIQAMEAEGDGLRRKAVERTLLRLNADGLLDPDRKRPLPRCPRRIAVITSPSGAAVRDVIAVTRRRSTAVEIVVVPATVQGDRAAESLCAALDHVARWGGADAVIIGRGGGGGEDLWAFNDERVARAVAACAVPTVSAVGHEVDLTICDLVADMRAPTPSAAAEAVVPLLDDLRAELRAHADALDRGAREALATAARALRAAGQGVAAAAARVVERRRARLEREAARLQGLSPLATLARGFAVPRAADGRPLRSAADFVPGSLFHLVVKDGTVEAVTRRVVGPG
ncbi:MAG TPA: exodeoxyribonuclease VII large subunit, partial [Gemmatimonadaceae bacterium]|nr:exodeoxyribonuclease VII large subunit [Gemmatimonadaceae bacterium]